MAMREEIWALQAVPTADCLFLLRECDGRTARFERARRGSIPRRGAGRKGNRGAGRGARDLESRISDLRFEISDPYCRLPAPDCLLHPRSVPDAHATLRRSKTRF